MKEITISLKLLVGESGVDALKRCIGHHLEELIDFDNWPEIRDYQSSIVSIEDTTRESIL